MPYPRSESDRATRTTRLHDENRGDHVLSRVTGVASVAEILQNAKDTIAFAHTHNLKRVLLDGRELDISRLSYADRLWLTLGLAPIWDFNIRWAFVIPSDHLDPITRASTMLSARMRAFDIQQFDRIQDALAWLLAEPIPK